MLKYGKRLIGAAGVLMMAGGVALSGLTAASASPAAHQSAALKARPAVRAATSGTEHFRLVTTSATSGRGHVIAYGLFTGAAVDIMGNRTDTFKFHGGSFKVRHSAGHGPQHFDPRTCLANIHLRGTFKVHSGTGKFAGISGHGRYQATVLFIGARNANGKCSQRKAPVAFQQTIKARGRLHL
jgi:hypothetical protein